MATEFIKGQKLCATFFKEAVQPLLAAHFPSLVYSAGRLGSGSDVIGYDSARSRDHDWGPRLTLFLSAQDLAALGLQIDELLRHKLPLTVCGYSTNFGAHDDGTLNMVEVAAPPVNHGVKITTVRAFCESYLGFYPADEIDELQWLQLAQQRLLTIRKGAIFWDGLACLQRLKKRLNWYPHEVWLFLMANGWRRISQEEPFMGRCGEEGDELGSRVVASRLVVEIMRLVFLQEKEYVPYFKWFGRAFSELTRAAELLPLFDGIWQAKDWQERERYFSRAYEYCLGRHNELNLTKEFVPKTSAFHSRPYLVSHGDLVSDAIHATVHSPTLKKLRPNVGAIDQFVDSTDVLSDPLLWPLVCKVHEL
jgi:hypothetical protein